MANENPKISLTANFTNKSASTLVPNISGAVGFKQV
jgi:hypothetical protein